MDNLFYRQAIEQLAEQKEDKQFFNSNAEHARIVLSTIFRHAEKQVNVYCGGFNSPVSNQDEYLKAVKSFLERQGSLRMLVTEERKSGEVDTTLLYRLLHIHPGQVEIKYTDQKYCIKDKPIHFTVADQKTYRLETDIEKRMAFGNFNDPEWGEKLTMLFDDAFSASKAIPFN